MANRSEGPVATQPITQIDPETGIPDLIRRLRDDSKRLAENEMRLAKLELHESMHEGVRGSIWLALALAFVIVAAVALTVLLIAAIGAALGDHYWAGALIVGTVEVLVGVLMLRHGATVVKAPSYSMPESRESLKDTAHWARHPAQR